MTSQTGKIWELCKSGKYICNTVFWANFIRYPAKRREELTDQLNRTCENGYYKWEGKLCKCGHPQVFMYRLVKINNTTKL